MNAALQQVDPAVRPDPVLRTLVLCDLADSTALVERLGDQRAAELLRRHDRLARDVIERHHGREIDKSDGFLLLFDRPTQGVAFALDYQRVLVDLNQTEGTGLQARVGVHVGEVTLWENERDDVARGAKLLEVEGLVKPVAARLSALALPGQILLSGMTYGLAQRSEADLKRTFPKMAWQFHGRFSFKGVPEPMPVYEVGETSVAPLSRPPSSSKAWRHVPAMLRPKVIFAELLLATVLVLGGLYFYSRTQPAIAFAERDWVVVGDLRNLTSQATLDETLETAFRISLEQSRFVNIVSDLSVRDALGRMKRDTTATPVDREVGSEIALREGARALIVPTVAEVGGRVRFSAEIVDPNTETSVFAHAADGVGAASTLDSIDEVTRELRNRLGESLASIDSSSAPLPKVTTGDLDALRAYALGSRALQAGRFREAIDLFEQASKLDPEFALAQLGLVRVFLSSDDRVQALKHLNAANAHRERLSAREALYLDAFLATYGKPEAMLEKWKLLTTVYPDFYGGYYNYSVFAWERVNRFADALAMIRGGDSPHNPAQGGALLAMAFFQLGLEQYNASTETLERSAELNGGRPGWIEVSILAATRKFERAQERLAGVTHSGIASNDVGKLPTAIALAIDQGHWDKALALAADARKDAQEAGPRSARSFDALEILLLAYAPAPSDFADRARAAVARAVESLGDEESPDREHALFEALVLGYFAQRSGHAEVAASVVEQVVPLARRADGYPMLAQALTLLEAERLRGDGDPAGAVERLATPNDGTELFLIHVARADALAQAGQWERAMQENQWLASHRGRAYAEQAPYPVLRPVNVLESNLATLRSAEVAARTRPDDVAGYLAQFEKYWPRAQWPAFVASRVAAIAPERG